MADLCLDNRFELINKYKQELIEATNIETSPEEMAVLDDILFRFWQMGWLDEWECKARDKALDEAKIRNWDAETRLKEAETRKLELEIKALERREKSEEA